MTDIAPLEESIKPPTSQWADVWSQFRSHTGAVVRLRPVGPARWAPITLDAI